MKNGHREQIDLLDRYLLEAMTVGKTDERPFLLVGDFWKLRGRRQYVFPQALDTLATPLAKVGMLRITL